MSRTVINEIESGRRVPQTRTYEKLRGALGLALPTAPALLRRREPESVGERQFATLAAWADAGAPEGDPKDAPKAPDFGDGGWRHGKPDLILTPADDFRLGASGGDLFRVFVIPTGLAEDRWVVGYDVKPGNPRVVHHTLNFFDTTGKGREMAEQEAKRKKKAGEEDYGPGYSVAMGIGFTPTFNPANPPLPKPTR